MIMTRILLGDEDATSRDEELGLELGFLFGPLTKKNLNT